MVTFPGSAVGAEAEVLRSQLRRFMDAHPGIRVETRPTPDAADRRHQLYVQWLNARAPDPDILQLDVVWTPEFAAAGWLLSLERFSPPADEFLAAAVRANRWRGSLYALPWYVDVGMLYWRTDLMRAPPDSFDELLALAAAARERGGIPYGFVWQGARYEGLVCAFLEHLGGFGGRILDDDGLPEVDAPAAVRALEFMRDAIYRDRVVPRAVLTWQEEQTRLAFQNGEAALMRNWPYAYALLQDPERSAVAGRFGVAPMPAQPGGAPTATLGGQQLAINANSDRPEQAWAVIEYLTRPEQMLERARAAGQYPARPSLYDSPELARAVAVPPGALRRIVLGATPRPLTPVYTQLSELLQIRIHRALTRQESPAEALRSAAREIGDLLHETGLSFAHPAR